MDYSDLVEVYEKLEKTSKRLEKTHILAEFLKTVRTESLPYVALLLQGNVFPATEEKKIGVAAKLVLKAIAKSSGIPVDKVENSWAKTGDLGETAAELIGKKRQATLFSSKLTVKKVMENLRKLATLEGEGTVERKVNLISELLTSASPKEAKFIIRTLLEELRVGVADGTLRDAIVWAYFGKEIGFTYHQKENNFDVKDREKYNLYADAVQNAYDMVNDFSEVIVAAQAKGLSGLAKSSLKVGAPIKVMLYPKAEGIKDAFEEVGKPAQFEYKFDGFRCIGGFTSLYVKNKGFLAVRDVKVGDEVLTHRGRFKKIIAKNVRKIDKGERIFQLQTFYGQKFKISEKHPVLVSRNNKLTWVPSENLLRTDRIAFPLPNITQSSILDNKLALVNSEGYKKIININDDFFRFLGYWIGDGFTNDFHNTERIGLLFNAKKDRKLALFYERLVKKSFGIKNVSHYTHNGALHLYWRDAPLKEWLATNFRREWKGKMIPQWFLGISKRQFEMFIKGWLESDGHIDEFDRSNITTKERDMAMMASLLGLKFRKMIGIIRFRVMGKTYYRLILTKNNRATQFYKNYVLINVLKLEEIKRIDPRFTLYNLQVDGDESYCTSMATLHNCQIHKTSNGKITVFTRRLENVTKQFPDVVEFVKEHVKAKEFIIDSEAVGYDAKTKKYVAFQKISQRIKRKYEIERMAKEFPVELNIFDVVEYEGENYMNKPFNERRKLLEKIIPKGFPLKIKLAEAIVTSSEKEAQEFYHKSLQAGNEGVMAKNLTAVYQPGRRVGNGVKIKPIMETLDVVIIGAEKGEGKRAGWLSSFIIACRDEDNDELVEIGRVSTGFKEKSEEGTSFEEMTDLLKPLIVETKGKIVKVRPKIIIEVAYEEIQKSPEYSSGYALRFPRLVRLREDRGPRDASTLREVDVLYSKQRGRSKKS